MTFALRPLLLCLCLLLIGPFGVQSALAQKYPDHPVRVLVGFSAGGPTDVIARLVAQQLSASLGQQFYVDDHPGAGGNIASAEAAKATPDGYTLIVVSTGFMVNMSLYANVPYDAVKDFAPITMVAYSPNVLVVNPSVPAKNVSELIALIKSSPGKYTFAGPGIGSTPHLSGELFKQKFDLDLTHVPFAGAAPAIAATIGGHTPTSRTASCARSRCSRSSAAARSPMCRPCERPAIPTRRPIRSPACWRRRERRRRSSTCCSRRSPRRWPSPRCRRSCSSSASCRWPTSRRSSARASRPRSSSGAKWCTTRICASSERDIMQRKVMIACAVTGSADTPSRNPAVPVTPQAIAASAIDAAKAGAAIVHIHVRDPQTRSRAW